MGTGAPSTWTWNPNTWECASVSPRLYLPGSKNQHFKMLNVKEDLFQAYAFYTAITVLKMIIMSFLTARQRFKTMTFISSEDAKQPGTKCGSNEDIERVR